MDLRQVMGLGGGWNWSTPWGSTSTVSIAYKQNHKERALGLIRNTP